MRPTGWPVPPRPPPWYSQYPAVTIPPPAPMGLPQQPLFPVQNVRPPVLATAPPTLQPSLPVAPPGLPVSNPPVPVSQPLFPVVPNNNFVRSLPMLTASVPLSLPAEVNNSTAPNMGNYSASTIGYQVPGNQCFILSLICIVKICNAFLMVELWTHRSVARDRIPFIM